ncbi:MAG: lipase maturation factor family protein [Verrucomicrobiaceae bacterium]|nr:lipase maturation factor family protein [Verrucomicrobiaceae bacterium]
MLWALYLSLLPIGQEWLAYGWDTQILETGFLAMMLAPLLDGRPFPRRAPPVVIIWLFRWLAFRIMLGAGLIKLRGDEVWSMKELSALVYHYETQPVPGPLSRFFHFLPRWFHQAGCLFNHFVEVVVPWFAFWGRWPRHIAGVLMVGFMGVLILTGNLSFLNWLTIIPCLACMDDSLWRRVLPRFITARAEKAAQSAESASKGHWVMVLLFTGYVGWWSVEPVRNLISPNQMMNTSFDPLHLVGSYGAFGSIDKERYELVFQGAYVEVIDLLTDWKDYEFKAKPTDVMRRPVWITPYHYRLDWAAWFPWHRYQGGARNAWVPHFLWKLLQNDPATLGLLAQNPFSDHPPKYVRVLVYRYRYAPADDPSGAWWTRERVETLVPAVSLEHAQLRQIMRENGWMREESR